MEVLLGPPLRRRGEGVEVVKVATVAGVVGVPGTLIGPLSPMERGRRKMGFLANPSTQVWW